MENTFSPVLEVIATHTGKITYFLLLYGILNQTNSKLIATWIFVFTCAIKTIAYAFSNYFSGSFRKLQIKFMNISVPYSRVPNYHISKFSAFL